MFLVLDQIPKPTNFGLLAAGIIGLVSTQCYTGANSWAFAPPPPSDALEKTWVRSFFFVIQ